MPLLIPNAVFARSRTLPVRAEPRPVDQPAPANSKASDVDTFATSSSVLGNVTRGILSCADAATTRESKQRIQTFGNCALEACRIMINRRRHVAHLPPVSERDFMTIAITQFGAAANGATNPEQQVKLLAFYGIKARVVTQTPALIQAAVMASRGAVVGVDMRRRTPGRIGTHAVLVIGVVKDAAGKATGYYVDDTGAGSCGGFLSAEHFESSLLVRGSAVVTDEALW